MEGFVNYIKKIVQPMRPYVPGENLSKISVFRLDTPELGGMIAVNPRNSKDSWYVSKSFLDANYEKVEEIKKESAVCQIQK